MLQKGKHIGGKINQFQVGLVTNENRKRIIVRQEKVAYTCRSINPTKIDFLYAQQIMSIDCRSHSLLELG